MSKPIVAIVGRPNVGKSTLFNKLAGRRISIIDDTPGVTRDRIYADCEWRGRLFSIIDTGGIEPYSKDEILMQMRAQAQLAIDSADVIIFVVDLRAGLVAADYEVASMLQKSGKPIVLCVNKCDSIGRNDPNFFEFYNLGLGEPVAVSSVHGHGTGDLLDEVFKFFPPRVATDENGDVINVAIIGKPNVGKSSLINKISGEGRSIVSDISGTTRDTVDSLVENSHGKFNFVDTAGIRRKSKIYSNIEKYSVIRAKLAIDRCDVCVIMIDATEGFTEQDSKIAGMAQAAGKGCIVAINKWDAIQKNDKTMDDFKKDLKKDFAFMSYVPFIFISAKTGQRVNQLFALIDKVSNFNTMRISTGVLNEILAEAVMRVQPPTDKGKRLKIFYLTQVSTRPPTFVFFVNSAKLFHFSYQRYLENRLRDAFDFEGTPIRFIIRER
ncbi:MAG: ribosome biogenesis GTPase Der [Clostridia bacterium]|nr:ribosome biogenesis GTPase Der [Clostridia bacterium]